MPATDEAPRLTPPNGNSATEGSGSKRPRDEIPTPSTPKVAAIGVKKRRIDDAGAAQVTLEQPEPDDDDDNDDKAEVEAAASNALSSHAQTSSPSLPMHAEDAKEESPHIIQSIEVDPNEHQGVLATASKGQEASGATIPKSTAAKAETRQRSPRSPSPIEDSRIPDWKAETRPFNGTLFRHAGSIATAIEAAETSQNGDLFVDGTPQFAIFCDGSSESSRFARFYGDRGGYGVVFRDPYETVDGGAGLSPNRLQPEVFGKDDTWGVKDFVVLNWLSQKTYSSEHAEMCAVSQGLEEVIKRVDHFGPPSSTVKIFSDSAACQDRIARGILVDNKFVAAAGGNNGMTKGSNPYWSRKRKRKEASFSDKHTNPILRTIIWQSHYLSERGCTIEIHWIPRNLTFAAYLADHVAGLWRDASQPVFSQANLPREQRDGIMDKLGEEINEIVRGRSTPPPKGMKGDQKKKRKLLRPSSKKKKDKPYPPKNMLLPKKDAKAKEARAAKIAEARRSFALRPSPSSYQQASSSALAPTAEAPAVSEEPSSHQEHPRPPTLDTFPTWSFQDAAPPRVARAPTPGFCWEIEDEDEIEGGSTRDEHDKQGETSGGEEAGEKENEKRKEKQNESTAEQDDEEC